MNLLRKNNTMNYKLPPSIGDRIVIGSWEQFPAIVTYLETLDDRRICIYVTMTYPHDSFFKHKNGTSKVYLHEEGDTWHRYNDYSKSN